MMQSVEILTGPKEVVRSESGGEENRKTDWETRRHLQTSTVQGKCLQRACHVDDKAPMQGGCIVTLCAQKQKNAYLKRRWRLQVIK